MKNFSLYRITTVALCACIVSIISGAAPIVSNAQSHYSDLTFPKLRDFNPPEALRVEMSNGMVLFLIEDHELPLVSISARIGVGSVHDPADKIGLASITGQVMRNGGSIAVNGNELDVRLDDIAASISISIGETSGSAFMSCLTEDVDEVLALFADVLKNPAFPQDKISLAKTQSRALIGRRNDDSQEIAFREFEEIIYSSNSPYARGEEYATVESITRADLVQFHAEYFNPVNTIMGLWGDFTTVDMVKKIDKEFEDWQVIDGFVRPAIPQPTEATASGVFFVPKSDVTQSTVVLGHAGEVRRNDPDYPALTVMNEVLSGGFSARLFQSVRDEQGLAYSVFGAYTSNFDRPGLFYAGVMTKSETTTEAAKSVLAEIDKMRDAPPTESEIDLAKDSFLNSFVFNFDTRSEVVSRLMTYEYHGYPKDFLQVEKNAIEKVRAEDVHRVSEKYLKPGSIKIMAVGNAADFGAPLEDLGNVTEVDITIPTADDASIPEATDESMSEGRAAFNKAAESMGGVAAFAAVSSLKKDADQTVTTPDNQTIAISLGLSQELPGRTKIVQGTPMGSMTIVVNNDEIVLTGPGGEVPAPPEVRGQIESLQWKDLTYMFVRGGDLELQLLGSVEFDGAEVTALRVSPPDSDAFTLMLTKESYRPVAIKYQGRLLTGGTTEAVDRFADFRQVGEILVPFKIETEQEGGGSSTIYTSVQVNPEFSDDDF